MQGLDPETRAMVKSLFADRCIPPPEDLPVSQTTNPYWDIIRTIPGNRIDWKYDHVWSPDWSSALLNGNLIDRHELCREYTFAIPDPTALAFVAKHLQSSAIEMGAGTGYWAWQLSQMGIDIIAYDVDPPNDGYNFYHNRDNQPDVKVYHPVMRGTPDILATHADRTLFLSWPPMSDMAVQCLEHYKGKRVVSIGEGSGGCTADEAFFEKLEQEWKEVAEHRIVQWWGIHDYITVYER